VRLSCGRSEPLAPSALRAVLASTVGVLLVAIVSATPRSPYYPVLPDGVEAQGPLRWIADAIGLQHLSDSGLMLVGLIAVAFAAFGFLMIMREAWNRRISMRLTFVLAIAFHVLVLTLPLLFSRDVYSYAYYGRIASTYGGNPYVLTPQDFPLNSLWHLTWPGWRDTPSVYGPLFTWVSVLMTGLARSVDSTIRGFQLLAALASLGTMVIVARLVQRVRPERAVFAVAVIGLNPIVVFHVVGGGHNDMLVALSSRRRSRVCSRGASSPRRSVSPRHVGKGERDRAAGPAAGGDRRDGGARAPHACDGEVRGGGRRHLAGPCRPVPPMDEPHPRVVRALGSRFGKAPGQLLVHALTWPSRRSAALPSRRRRRSRPTCCVGLSLVAVWVIARRIWTESSARTPMAQAAAWGWALLIVILLAPMLGTWYLVWVLPLAWAMPRVARRTLVVLCVAFTVTELVTENTNLPDLIRSVRLPFGHPIAIIVCVWIAVDLIRRLRRNTPLDAETGERQFGDAFEAGPRQRSSVGPATPRERRIEQDTVPAPTVVASEGSRSGGSLIPLRFARRR
jgi:hypothetical protein